MDKKTKIIIYVAIGVTLLMAAIGYYFYKQGKKTTTLQYGPGELPGNPSSGNVLGASNEELKVLAAQLHDEMSGLNLFGHDMAPYEKALTLSDTDLIKLYNAFNTKYQSENGETLTGWIENEKFYNNEVTDTLLLKLNKLNLK